MRRCGNGLLLTVTVTAAICGLSFGYDTSGVRDLLDLKTDPHSNQLEQRTIVSSLILGGIHDG